MKQGTRRTSDPDLLECWAHGDECAGAMLFDRYFDSLQRFFCRRAPDAAEDLMQATFLACVEKRDRLAIHSSFKAYLFGIARHQLYGHYRKGRAERGTLLFNTTSRYHRGPSPSSAVENRSEDRILMLAMQALPRQMQMLLELAYWEDMSAPELADVLQIPVSAIHSRLHRAKQRLRAVLLTLDTDAPA